MEGREKACEFAKKAPPLRQKELEEINALFPAYIFRRSKTREVWTSCCHRYETLPDIARSNAEYYVLTTEHQREPKHMYQPAPKETVECPFCGKKAILKELGRTGNRDNLSRCRRAVVLRWYRGALWARAYDCGKHYGKKQGYSLTGYPKYKLVGVYRFKPGLAEATIRNWWTGSEFRHLCSQKNGLIKGKWNIPRPFNYNADYGFGYDVIGADEIEKSPFRYCMAEKARRKFTSFLRYLTACCFYPRQIEMLMKAGRSDVVLDLVERGVKNAAVMNWDEPDIRKAMGLTALELREFIEKKPSMDALSLRKQAKRWLGLNWTISEAMDFYKTWTELSREVLRFCRTYELNCNRLQRYLDDNCIVDPDLPWLSVEDVFREYRDYLEAQWALGACMQHGKVLWPDDLHTAHDQATAELSARSKVNVKNGPAKGALRKEKYTFEYDGLRIIFPPSSAAIKAEGSALCHCVGGYADRHIKGVLTILFLRRVDEPNKPYVTIEMDGNRIVQVHGYRNDLGGQSPRVTHKEFFDVWLAWLKAGSKRDKEGNPILPKKRKRKVA